MAEFQKLPEYIRNAVCNYDCEKPDYVPYSTLLVKPMPLGPKYPYGSYCQTCKRPFIFSIWVVARECENCEKLYVPEAKRGNFPVKYNICPDCAAKIPTRVPHNRRPTS